MPFFAVFINDEPVYMSFVFVGIHECMHVNYSSLYACIFCIIVFFVFFFGWGGDGVVVIFYVSHSIWQILF